jgi:mono/diheme cytochrome c family protein
MYTYTPIRLPASLLVVACLTGLSGCGTNFDEVLYQTASATSRTFLDILLTDLANTLADSFDQRDTPASEDEDDGDNGGGDTNPPDGPPLEELTGDPGTGEGVYASNACAPCHCADAGGGCALSAPSLVGVETETLDDRLRGDVNHPGGKVNLTNQEIVDLQAYLAGLDTDNG